MSFGAEKSYQDITVFNIDKKSPPAKKKTNLAVIIAASILVTVTLLAIGYCVGRKAGYFAASCCIGPFELQFDFER